MRKKLAVASLFIVLALVNWSIFGKEKQLAEGNIVYLELATVDPRSLMQGDYLALRFRLAAEVSNALAKRQTNEHVRLETSDGYVIVGLNESKVGSMRGLYDNQPLSGDEMLLHYRVRDGVVKFATNAFFFQEGRARDLQRARYGQFRVDNSGELLLAAVSDRDLKKL